MDVIHVVPSMALSAGGPPRSVGQLCDCLSHHSQVTLLTASESTDSIVTLSDQVKLVSIKAEHRSIFHSLCRSVFFDELVKLYGLGPIDVLHQHGIWLRCSHDSARFANKRNIPLVVAPRGMLEPWAMNNRKWKKRLAWGLYQRQDLNCVTAFHATALSEADSIRRLGFKQPIAVIPNGIVLPDSPLPDRTVNSDLTNRTVLFLSRINPKKGLLMLLDAWKMTAPVGWCLRIAGNDDSNHLADVEKRIFELDLQGQVEVVGPLFGDAKKAAYRNADLFVLPSYSENFGIVIAEALGFGVPVLATTGCPWRDLEVEKCGWWVKPTVSGISEGLREAFNSDAKSLVKMGVRGRMLVENKYQWPGIVQRMIEFYSWLTKGGKQPDFVV